MRADESDGEWVRRLARSLGAELVETHISWVLLTGTEAYKLKKPLRLPFLDYSTPGQRQQACEEEVRLNARLAPSLYLGVSRVTGPRESPAIDGPGELLDHAVRMRRFPRGALFSEQLAAGVLREESVDRLARRIAGLHRTAAACTEGFDPDEPGRRAFAAREGAASLLAAPDAEFLGGWLRDSARDSLALRAQRFHGGHVREGHGDLHLDNLVTLDGEVTAFDCIEFDPALRFIDVIDDACFPLMDFAARGRADLGWRFFNGWLDETGEHGGLPLLRHGLVYRALVRAQVESLRGRAAAAQSYAATALSFARPAAARLAITHGLPGSGKTVASQRMLQAGGAIRLRTDVERKRLFGLRPLDRSADLGVDLYSAEATRRTYAHVLELAGQALACGWPVVIDGAFLRHAERDRARALASRLGVEFGIAHCAAPLAELRRRLMARQGDASEADVQVLEQLSLQAEPLSTDEQGLVLDVP
ncbi:AAA family ATPase [Ramlibacter sp. AW1]|uniref:AAA family ATPase n=1 Tax=Ramlibacter aurantiacus TaxID=2801330 RepID=A0A936ZQU4_9BURK|nr:bifunctional aminoglycoside phosphotransferase/ATP-binding protein [Ramlibacter aurantiacus]MBL0419009.1 AAA family ATPase [Ramlibacter aurantiacus]